MSVIPEVSPARGLIFQETKPGGNANVGKVGFTKAALTGPGAIKRRPKNEEWGRPVSKPQGAARRHEEREAPPD